MADSNFEGTNLLGGPFKPYVDEQVAQRQTRLGSIQKSQEDIIWENGKSAYLALASSVNIENSITTTYQTVSNRNSTRNVVDQTIKHNDGEKRIQQLGLPDEYYGNQLANNLVLFGGTAYFETNDADKNKVITSNEYSNPYYRSGLATSDSLLNNSAYGFGGTSFGLSAMPGLTSFNIKSKNMGSLREASVTIRANNKEQFSLIDSLYCRIGYTMFMEWGNSIYFNNDGKYVSNPNASGVTSLLPIFLSGTNGNKSISDNPSQFLKLIEDRREKSNGNYDAFFGKVKNFSWEFNPAGYYEISLSLISQGDIIESLNIDGQYGGTSTNLLGKGNSQPQPNQSSALTSFLSTVASPNGIYERKASSVSTEFQKQSISKFTLVPTTLNETTDYFGMNSDFKPTSTASDTIESLNYTRLSGSLGKIVSATATFGSEKPYFYIRLGDILDFIKDRLLIYSSKGNNEPLLDIDTDTLKNICYYPGINVSADPSKVMVNNQLPYSINNLIRLSKEVSSDEPNAPQDWSYGVNQESVFRIDGKARLENFGSVFNPNNQTPNFPLHGKIMNIYFEYEYLLNAIKGLRNEKTGTISLYDFVDELCQTANSCLGGVNKLSIRLEDDRIMRIYDQSPIYGTQNVQSSLINLYGINPTGSLGNQGSFVTDFNIKTELTNDFATQVTIGAQAQNNNVGSDATGLSAWNSGLVDRFFPEKIDSLRKVNGTTLPTTQERIDKLTQQLKYLWLGYSQGKISEESITSVNDEKQDRSTIDDRANVIDFIKRTNVYYFKYFDTKSYSSFVKLQKDWLQEIIKLENENFNKIQASSQSQTLGTNQIGMIPINISVTLEGISGIRIYDKLEVDTRFLPSYYPQTLIWIIKGVSHEIQNNKWYTKLETIAVPKLPISQDFKSVGLDQAGLRKNIDNTELDNFEGATPNADRLRAVLNQLGYSEKQFGDDGFGRDKDGPQISNGGDISSPLANYAIQTFKLIKEKYPNLQIQVSGGNDLYHQNQTGFSHHKKGNGLDFTITPFTRNNEKAIENILYAIILGTPRFHFLNEYDKTTENTTGGHFHISYGSGAEGSGNLAYAKSSRQNLTHILLTTNV